MYVVAITLARYKIDMLIHGGAPGADTLADIYAKDKGIPRWPFEVTGEQWRLLGKKAGPMRNARMLAEAKPDIVVAFPGGNGTADMVRQAKAAGVPVRFAIDAAKEPP